MVQLRPSLDRTFGALSDPTRRAILLRLARGEASLTALAGGFDLTLTGLKKHVSVLEDAGLVETEKVGRVRRCRLHRRGLDEVTDWIAMYRHQLEDRLDRLEAFLQRTEGDA
jgi:DNA-binding transcriptional ArsR family regulator